MSSAEELHQMGVGASVSGDVSEAQRLLNKARELAVAEGNNEVQARAESTLAYLAADESNFDKALDLLDRALTLDGLKTKTSGALLQQRATLLRRAGRAAESLAVFGEAIRALANHPGDLADAYLNRGTVHLDRFDLKAAVEDFRKAADSYLETGNDLAAAQADHNRAYALFLSGDLVGALALMESSYALQAAAGPLVKAVCDADRAEVLMAAGLTRQGGEMLRQAAEAYGSKGQRQRQGEAELVLASHLVATDPAEAERVARSALGRFEEAKAPGLALRARAVAFEAAVTAREDPSEDGEALAGPLEEQGLNWPALRVRLQARLARIRSVENAGLPTRPASGRVIGPVAPEAPIDIRLLERELRAELAVAAGRTVAGLRELRAGLDDFHLWQSSFGSLDLQTNVAGHGRTLARRGLELAVESGETEVLFEWSERSRMLASRVQPVRPPSDPQLAADLAELRGEVSPEREHELREQIRQRAWRVKGSGQVSDPISLPDLRERIGGHALVGYVVAAGRIVALVATDDAATRIDLGEQAALGSLLGGLLPDLDVAATDLPGPLGAAVRGDLTARLQQLSDLLVAPILDRIGDRPVVLTPSAVLAAVPWTLLSGFTGRPVTVAQSATAWLSRADTPLRTQVAGFVAGPRVMRAADEVAHSATAWRGSRILTGADATASAVSALAAEVDVLHLAAHGHHSADNPLFSGLELADGTWYGYDIDGLAAVPDVVLLSACEVGRSTIRWGEELIGLVGAWLHAGARAVIASPAVVADEAAYEVFSRLHGALAKGLAPAEALAESLPAVTTDAPPAPFVCFS
ncbi:CHAT domain-containing tetratricopeptide repeat protein [Nocardioides sp. NPDC000445]|uniref:CHAT domain-containing protein n=1 Tax=Nocardioides sp. NPDC000445 TaxID=3154257 RepID=UPI003330740B